MKLLKYFFVMAFLVSVSGISAFADPVPAEDAAGTGQNEAPRDCRAIGNNMATAQEEERPRGDVRTGGNAGDPTR